MSNAGKSIFAFNTRERGRFFNSLVLPPLLIVLAQCGGRVENMNI